MGFGFLHRFIKGKQKSVAAPRDAHHWQGLQQLEPRLLLSGSGYVDTQDHDDDTTDSLTILHSGFEAGWDGWTQETSDSFDWARISGQTVSSDTGPSAAADGNWYIYIESSSPNYPNKMASLVSPTLDLSGISDPSLSFDYHMYGSDIGQLSVQITTDGAVWEEVFSISGQQHPSSPSAWSQANINLDNYAGLPEVKLRFKGFTGDSYRGDISIDDVTIFSSAHSNSVPTGTVTITGMEIEGEILTASNDLADEDGMGGAWDSSSWGTVTMLTNNCTTRNLETTLTVSRATATIKASTSATSDTYVYLRDDAGQTHGTFAYHVSNYATLVKSKEFDPPIVVSEIKACSWWNAAKLEHLELEVSSITYQWNRDGQPITGATGKAYALVQDDVGSVITVVASYTDHNGTDESVISDATGIVTAVDTVPPTNNSISINGGNTYADSTSVTLTLASTGASQMRFKNESDGTYTSYESYATSKSWTLGSGDGTKTVYVQFKDTAGNTATAVSDAITLDSLAPVSNSISIDGGNAYADSTSVTLTLASTGATQMQFKNESGSYTSWEPYATSKSWSLLDTQGTRTVSVQFKDAAGNTATAVSDAITLDSLAPVSNSISINGGNTYADSTSVTLTLASTGASQMRFKNESGSYTSWEPYATSKSWSLLDTQGTRTVSVQFKDAAGNTATAVSDAITLDSLAPVSNSISINGGNAYTDSTSVTLMLASTGASLMQFKNESGSYTSWEPYATSKSWSLLDTQGTRTVSVQFKDAAGNTATAVSDAITLDSLAPVSNSISINGGNAYTDSTSVTLTLASTGASLMRLKNESGSYTSWEPYATSKSWSLLDTQGTWTVSVQFKDAAGNTATAVSDAITFDINDLPTGTVTIDGVPEEGQTLTASNTLSDDDGLGPINYQWTRGDHLYGAIAAWGRLSSDTPADGGYTQIVGNPRAFAALKEDGSITAWGHADYGGSGAPTGNGYTQIISNDSAFAALKSDGSIAAWGGSGDFPYAGESSAPTGNGYTQIISNDSAFAALKSDGSIAAWGNANSGGSGEPTDNGYTQIIGTPRAFAALKEDGSITAWGHAVFGVRHPPTDNGYTQIIGNNYLSIAALKEDGSITAWGHAGYGGSGAPTNSGYTQIVSNWGAFAALKEDGSITAWGHRDYGGNDEPNDSGYTQIAGNIFAFAALKEDGSITAWDSPTYGGSYEPNDSGYTQIVSSWGAFAALKEDGSIAAWGHADYGGSGEPTDNGYTQIISNDYAFAAIKADGSITAWGDTRYGGSGAPSDNGYSEIVSNIKTFAAIKGAPVVVATSPTYTATQADVGFQITVTAIYTDGYGTPESVSSDPTVSVENVNDLPTGTVTIEGVVKEGQFLSVANDLADEDELGLFSYQWHRDGLAIDGATSSTYTLMQDDVNSKTAVVMSYTDGYGSDESVTSDPIGPVYSNIPSQLTGHLVYPGVAVIVETQTVDLSGFTFVASALMVEASGTLTGYGSVSAPVSGNGTIELIGGNMSLGDLNDPSGFDFDGTLKLNGHTAVLQDSDVAGLGMTTALGNGGTLIATNDLVLGEGRQINGSGEIISRTLDHQGSIHVIGGSLIIRGNLSGNGDFPENGEVVILGDYQPGNSPAVIDFGGDVAFGSSANLVLEINGAEPGSGYDQLNIAGDLGAGGTLEIVLGEDYAPVGGESFNLLNFSSISGVFSQVTFSGQPLNDGLLWDDSRLYSDGSVRVASQALPPVITLVGDANMTLEASRTGQYMDLGATCTSNVDGNLNHAVEVSGQIVDMRVPGTYTIQYNCTDLTGQSAQPATRNIEVKDTMPPVITLSLEDIVIHVGDNTHTGLGGETNINESQPQPTSENAVGKAFRLVSPIYRPHDLSYTQPDGSAVKSRQDWTMKLAANSIEVILPVATAWDRVDDSVEVTVTIYLVDLDGDGQTSVQSQVDLTRRSTYLFKYDVQDQSGNHAEQVAFALILNDLESPSISLAGGLTQVVEAGSDWELGQSTAHDNIDGDLTDQVRYAVHDVATQAELGSDLSYADAAALVDTMILGKFLVTVEVSDAAGIYGTNSVNNTARKYQAVEVRDTMPPVIIALPVLELDEGDTIHMTGPDLTAYASDQYALPSNLEFRIVNFSDIASEFGLTIGMDSSSGSFAPRTDTTLHVHPSPHFSGTTTVSIEARDSSGNVSNLQSFVLTITPDVDLVPGDANQDGMVDIADLGIVGANFNKTSVEWSQGDFNGDEKVDIADLGIIGANWTAADSAVVLYAASNPRTSMLHAQGESGRSNRLDLTALLQQDDQNELANILGAHSIL